MGGSLGVQAPQLRGGWARWGAVPTGLALVLVLALAGLAWGEWAGWPMLAAPLAQALSSRLGRPVSLSAWPPSAPLPRAAPGAVGGPPVERFSLRFLGGLRLAVPQLTVAAPPWAAAPPTLLARDLRLHLRYRDLWRAWRQRALHIHSLQAGAVVIDLVRMADGQASWLLPSTSAGGSADGSMPTFGELRLADGRLQWRDARLHLDAQARWVLALQPLVGPSAATAKASVASSASSASSAVTAAAGPRDSPGAGGQGFTLDGSVQGQYQGRPVQASLRASLGQGVTGDGDGRRAAPLQLDLQAAVGRARLSFDGGVVDALAWVGTPGWLGPTGLQGLTGKFTLQGPSLAAVGDPVGVTLPTTRPFRSAGRLRKDGSTWFVVFDDARIGKSQLHGAFSYDTARPVPLLAGRLSGPRLLLADLGPAVGVPTEVVAARRPGKLLPDRPFDLKALRVMDANVLISVDELDLDTAYLEPLRPLRAHLQLKGGVLDIRKIDARAGPGRLHGSVQLDGRLAVAAMSSDLRWEGLRLEQWIHQNRGSGKPPWASGTVKGLARLQGQGNSTASILSHLTGRLQADWQNGRISHLAVEAAGLDLAESLGVLIKGDDALTVNCAVADLVAERGVFKPRLMVIDSTDSTLWLDGSVSLATEVLDLRVIVSPKDFSPLALRAPLRLRGNLADPQVSIDTARLAGRLGLAGLLALINPLAGLLPLLDPGDTPAAARDAAGCRRLDQRVNQRVNQRMARPQTQPVTRRPSGSPLVAR